MMTNDVRKEASNLFISGTYNRTSPSPGTLVIPRTFYNATERQVSSYRGPRQAKDPYGWVPPNNFGLIKYEYEVKEGGALTWNDKTGTINGTMSAHAIQCFVPGTLLDPSTNYAGIVGFELAREALYQAQLEAWADANDSDCPGLVWLAEGKETVSWLRDICKGVKRAIISYDARMKTIQSVKDVKRKTDQAASAWLQFRYAITPLALQIEDAIELLSEKKRKLETITGYVKKTVSEVSSQSDYTYYNRKWRVFRKKTIQYRGAAKLYPSALKPEFDWGFTPFDAIIAYWNVMKLSFVVDWFVNVGSFLGAYRPGGAEIAHQSNTLIYDIRIENHSEMIWGSPGWTQSYSPEQTVETVCILERTTDITKPKLPTFNVEALSLLRQCDAVSLLFGALTQFLRKK